MGITEMQDKWATLEFRNGPEKLHIGLYEKKNPSLLKCLMQLGFWIKKLSENISLHMYFVYFPVAVKAKDSCFIFTTGHVRLQRLWN